MVLVHSRPADVTTLEVIQWLQHYGKSILRLNNIEDIEKIQNSLSRNELCSAYYNGRGFTLKPFNVEDEVLKNQILDYLKKDITLVMSHLLSNDGIENYFGNMPYDETIPNKLQQLTLAKSLGFKIPEYEIVTSRKRLTELKNKWGRIICKAFGDGINIDTSKIVIHGQKTQEISWHEIDQTEEHFFPTFIQQLIAKEFEVRTFCFRDINYSIAIFSQSNETSVIDSRSNDPDKPQRQIPFNLPSELLQKSQKLLSILDLNYGSLDFIVTPEDEFYFLEVNPYGQYGYVSQAGNFYIEKQIAERL